MCDAGGCATATRMMTGIFETVREASYIFEKVYLVVQRLKKDSRRQSNFRKLAFRENSPLIGSQMLQSRTRPLRYTEKRLIS